jgi:hypothetical protein
MSRLNILLTDRRFRFVGLAAILSLLWSCYPTSKISYSNPQDSAAYQWLGEYKTTESKIQLTLRYRRLRDSGFSYSDTGFSSTLDQLIGLTREQVFSSGTNVKFQLKRDAGAFNLEGWFKDGNGSGHFTFSPNASFAAELDKQGFGRPTDEQLLSLAMNDTGFAFINELKAQGYDTSTVDQLVKLGNHGVNLDYLQGLKAMGYSVKSTELVTKMRDHGVNLSFIRGLADLGYTNLAPEELIRTKDHGVSPKFITEFVAAGYNRLTLDEWITLKDHGVSTSFVAELKELGYQRLPIEDLRNMKDHGVSGAFIQELKELGYTNVPVELLIRLKDHGVSGSYIRRLKDKGYEVTLDEYIRMRDRGTKEFFVLCAWSFVL